MTAPDRPRRRTLGDLCRLAYLCAARPLDQSGAPPPVPHRPHARRTGH
ncbi:hypothetical protein BJY24_006996 [Nocardia transvalensis]|uniref:Uncharacterized protein n=1 Tax=Nocardia transvalensis TaxID=37333 RepID=A0A7W9PKX6_9NOCA|nr:hypothetical protein [Nocardia transvalensis]MBB5918084.1 hypothetical protein [Nocardia transvalensis]